MQKTLILGASLNPNRYSYVALQRLAANGIETVAIGLKVGNVAGIDITTQAVDFKNIDTVSLYLNAKNQENYYQYIVDLKPRRVLFNPGTENPQFYTILKSNGIEIQQACTLVLLSTGQY